MLFSRYQFEIKIMSSGYIFDCKKTYRNTYFITRSVREVSFRCVNVTVGVLQRAGTAFSSCRTHFLNVRMKLSLAPAVWVNVEYGSTKVVLVKKM